MAFNYLAPGVYIEEVATGARSIEAVGTSVAAFVGAAPLANARLHEPVRVENFESFKREFTDEQSTTNHLCQAVWSFFQNGGACAYIVNTGPSGALLGDGKGGRKGIETLEVQDNINMVMAPGASSAADYDTLLTFCEGRRNCVALLDAPLEVANLSALTKVATVEPAGEGKAARSAQPEAGLRPRTSDRGYGSFFFPWFLARNALAPSTYVFTPPSGAAAGIYSRTDAERGVHKAPANELVRGAYNLRYRVSQKEQEELNSSGVNVIRFFGSRGPVLWGARTLAASSSEWKYTSVRRLFCMLEESLALGTQWVVFEPNDETLWKSIRRDCEKFLMDMWRAGMLMGSTPQQAFFVRCDAETNPQSSIDAGRVITLIGVAPVKPAEFVVFKIGQSAGGTDTVEAS